MAIQPMTRLICKEGTELDKWSLVEMNLSLGVQLVPRRNLRAVLHSFTPSL